MKSTTLRVCYRNRFSDHISGERLRLWETLNTMVFSRYIDENCTVMDIGAGRCEFINTVTAKRKIAVDINPDTKKYAKGDVKVLGVSFSQIPTSYDGTIDVIMISNFLEHLPTKQDATNCMKRIHTLLKPGGIVIILQPNIDLVKEKYWDFIDHTIPFNTKSIIELLEITQFTLFHMEERFLPYTTKSIFPLHPFFVQLYLQLPEWLRPFAGQSLFIGKKS